VIAYGTVTKRFNTGNVATVKAEEISRQPVTNLLDALSGLVPGLLITQQNGLPGSNFKVELRGQNSVNGGEPLYIVDGIPYASNALGQVAGGLMLALNKLQQTGNASEAGVMGLSPLNSINPADIASIDVLKDGDATAIYGSRGANGVILITTKKGKTGAPSVSAGIYQGITNLSKRPKFLSRDQYLAGRREVFRNDGTTPGTSDYDLNGTWDSTRDYNLADEMIKSTSTTNGQLSISGGNGQTQFMAGVNYSKVSPPYDGNFSDKRIGANFNISSSAFNNKFRFMFSGSYGVDNNTLPGMSTFGTLNLPPVYPAFHKADGTLNWWGTSASNPYAQLLKSYNAVTRMLISNISLSYQLMQGLELKSNLGYTYSQFNEFRQNPLSSMNPLLGNNISSALWGRNGGSTWIFEPSLDYKRRLYGGTINVLLGATMQENVREGQTTSAYNFLSDAALTNINAAAQTLLNNNYSKYHYAAVFGRINYIFQEKYVLNLTGRRDGSSRFAPDRRVSNFGAIGGAWIFGEEAAVKKLLPFLSFAKLRGSYGLTGNDGIGDYRYLSTYTIGNTNKYYNLPGLLPTRLYSTDYSWESNRKLEGGLELGFIKDRILLSVSWFRNRCSNQLVDLTMPPTAGIGSIQANLPALIQNQGWEFELRTKNLDKGSFTWSSSFNLSFTRNKLLDYPGLATSPNANRFVVGQPLSLTKLYQGAGVDPLTGLYQFRKADGSVATLGLLATDMMVLRNTNPDFYGMLNNAFKYKGWQLNVTFRFMKQTGKNILFTSGQSAPFTSPANIPTFFLDQAHWQKPGDIAKVQKYSNAGFSGAAYSSAGQSDMAYTDASFIRCKNVALSYQFSQSWLKRLHVSGANLFCNVQNLFTISGYLGYDPETQGTNLPPMRTIAWGLQLNL
jgi:TonB-linked SusC/RagA family outer membrane protein